MLEDKHNVDSYDLLYLCTVTYSILKHPPHSLSLDLSLSLGPSLVLSQTHSWPPQEQWSATKLKLGIFLTFLSYNEVRFFDYCTIGLRRGRETKKGLVWRLGFSSSLSLVTSFVRPNELYDCDPHSKKNNICPWTNLNNCRSSKSSNSPKTRPPKLFRVFLPIVT